MRENKLIGFIGLGIMGKPMAKNLIKAGYRLVVYDISPEPVEELVATGQATAGKSPKDVAEQTQCIVLMLPNSPHVEEVVLGTGGVLEGASAGLLLIDMSSIAPLVSRKIAEIVAEKEVRFLDAPVSGGEPGAIKGTLSIMVGGNREDFEEALPILREMGSSVVRVGDVGSGNITKLANQIMVALNIAAMSEALVLGTKAGVDPMAIYEAVRGGLAGSNVLDAKAPLIMERKFDPGFRIELHIKDLMNSLETARDIGVPLPLTSLVAEMMRAMAVAEEAHLDHGGLVRFYERLARVEVVPKATAGE
jgi:2-hydroxy-3-oxopropionate reductase